MSPFSPYHFVDLVAVLGQERIVASSRTYADLPVFVILLTSEA